MGVNIQLGSKQKQQDFGVSFIQNIFASEADYGLLQKLIDRIGARTSDDNSFGASFKNNGVKAKGHQN